jgi:hypothetical protein
LRSRISDAAVPLRQEMNRRSIDSCSAWTGVVGAIEGEVVQRGELGLDPVELGATERNIGQFSIVTFN